MDWLSSNPFNGLNSVGLATDFAGYGPPEWAGSPLPQNAISPDWTAFFKFGYVAWKTVHANDGHASDEPRDLAVFTVHA